MKAGLRSGIGPAGSGAWDCRFRRLRLHAALHGDQRGQASLEWVMLMVAFGLPMVIVFGWLLGVLAEYYRMVTFLHALPFP